MTSFMPWVIALLLALPLIAVVLWVCDALVSLLDYIAFELVVIFIMALILSRGIVGLWLGI